MLYIRMLFSFVRYMSALFDGLSSSTDLPNGAFGEIQSPQLSKQPDN